MGAFTLTLEEVIEMEGEDNIGLSDYPIFDEAHRTVLNQKIIDHYYNQEIGQETVSMFRLALKRKMNEIMPEYNQQYELSAIKLNALLTVDVESTNTNTSTASSNAEGSTVSDSDAKSRAVASQFPQNALQANSEYATSAQDNISHSDATGSSTETQETEQTGSGTAKQTGFNGHQPELIWAARQTIVNIDLEIINRIQSVFLGIWFAPSEFSRVRNQIVYPTGW